MKLFLIIAIALLVMAIKANASDKLDQCKELATRLETEGSHKYNGTLYVNDFVYCGEANKEVTIYRKIAVMVKNSKAASNKDIQFLENQYKDQIAKDLCPGISPKTWTFVDVIHLNLMDLDKNQLGLAKLTQKDCKNL